MDASPVGLLPFWGKILSPSRVVSAQRSLMHASLHLLPEAGAKHERRLEAVRCKRVLGALFGFHRLPGFYD